MSLIKCMECGRKISDRSRKCTYCGFPIEEYYEYLEFQKRKLNTQCSFKGTVIDFSDIVPRFKDKYSFDVFDDLCAKFEEYEIDIAYSSIMNFVKEVMTTHIIPEIYDKYETQTDIEEHRSLRLFANSRCIIKHNDIPYDFSYLKKILKEHHQCTEEAIKYIKKIPELSEEEQKDFIRQLNYLHCIPFTFPYDENKIMQVDAINYITNYWGRDTESKPHPKYQSPTNQVFCPNCGGNHINKIKSTVYSPTLHRMGLLQNSFMKIRQCKNCGYKW